MCNYMKKAENKLKNGLGLIFILFFKDVFVYSKGRVTGRERNLPFTVHSSIHSHDIRAGPS